MTVLRWHQILCPTHQRAAAREWLWDDLTAITACAACTACMTQHDMGAATLSIYPHLPPAMRRYITAIHEAGHAIVGLHSGLDLDRITLASDTDGQCSWRDTGATITRTHYAAMARAGHDAATRWVRLRGHDDDRMRIDLSAGARHDYVALRAHRIDPAIGRDYAGMVIATYWDTIVDVAQALCAHGQVSAAELPSTAICDI